MTSFWLRTGAIDLHLRENAGIAVRNVMNGRPLREGALPETYVPDPDGRPEWIEIQMDER